MENVRKLEFKRENIVSAHKVDKSGNVMLVSFDSSNTKDRIFKVKKKHRHDATMVYINDYLASRRVKRFKKARELRKMKKIEATWDF
jgi:hypothetical protein